MEYMAKRGDTADYFPQVYAQLRKLASRKVAAESKGKSLNATALVHEAFLKLSNEEGLPKFDSPGHFYVAASEAMRWILIDRARARQRLKREGSDNTVELEEWQIVAPAADDEMLQVHEALEVLEKADPECANLVKMRFFSGFTLQEIAGIQEVSYRTIKRRWSYAKAWLQREIQSYGK